MHEERKICFARYCEKIIGHINFGEIMSKDNTKYIFNGNTYCKRQLVKAIVEDYINHHKDITFSELEEKFPPEIQQNTKIKIASYGIIKKTVNIPESMTDRFFSNKIKLSDGNIIQIFGGWDKDNIDVFIKHAEKLGYLIKSI